MWNLSDIHDALRRANATIGVAESLTGGLLAAALTQTPGASETFRGGVVVYATELKQSLGRVPADVLAMHGPVSEPTAESLAIGARDLLGATYGLATTGVAGPTSQNGVPLGTVYLGLAGPLGQQVQLLHLAGDRAQVRQDATYAALDLLAQALELDGNR